MGKAAHRTWIYTFVLVMEDKIPSPEELNEMSELFTKELEARGTHKKERIVFEVDEEVSLLAEKVELDLDKILG